MKREPILQKGQSLILFVVLSVALIGIVALTYDIGYAYVMRRAAQNAADAGALAGASTLCGTGVESVRIATAPGEALKFAGDYSITGSTNRAPGAVNQSASVDSSAFAQKKVGVTVTVDYNTILAGFFGTPTNTVRATAAAGCKPGGIALGALPVAKDCGTLTQVCNGTECKMTCSEIDFNPDDDVCVLPGNEAPGQTADLYYVFVNDSGHTGGQNDPYSTPSVTDEYVCSLEQTNANQKTVNCDYDKLSPTKDMEIVSTANPNKDKWMWVDLSPTANCTNSSCLKNVVNGSQSYTIHVPIWIFGGSGAHNTVYDEIANYRIGDIVALPVFDRYCFGNDPENPADCTPYGWVGGDNKILTGTGANDHYFRIIAWAWLKITDVCDRPNCTNGGNNPARDAMFNDTFELADGSFSGPRTEPNNLMGFEGCFVSLTSPLVQGVGGIDTGVYSVYLIK